MAQSDNQRARKRPRAKASLLDIGLRLADSLGLPPDRRGAILDLTEELESRLLEAASASEYEAASGSEPESLSASKQFTAPRSAIPPGVPTRATGSTSPGWNFKPPVPSDGDGSYQEFEAVVVSGEAIDVGCALSISGDRVKVARVATVTDPDLWCNAVCTRIVSPTKVRYRCGGTLLVKKRVTTASCGTVFLSSGGWFTDEPDELVSGREFVQYLGTWKEYARKPDALGGGDSGIGYACFAFTPPILEFGGFGIDIIDGGDAVWSELSLVDGGDAVNALTDLVYGGTP